jgi:hypothetical protein
MTSLHLALFTLGLLTWNRPELSPEQPVKPALQKEIGDLSGYYTCKGTELGGKSYSGVVVLAKKGDVYVVRWIVGAGTPFTGVGIRQGDTFAAGWALQEERGLIRGVNMYRVEPGPRLIGRWASLPGPALPQNETLTFLKHLEED